MSKIESNIQLPTVILGALLAIIIERAVRLLFYVPVQNYVQELASEYQFAADPENIPWWIENLVLNGLLPEILLLLAATVFALAFYLFVVRDKRIRLWSLEDAKKRLAKKDSQSQAAKKTTKKKTTTTKKS